jgi:hypothetical protein
VVVRVIDYRLEGVADAELVCWLVTTILDREKAPAKELAALYHERGEIETALDELKTHPRGSQIVLRSKTPDLVRQEFYGLLLAHFSAIPPSAQETIPSERAGGDSAGAGRLQPQSAQSARGEAEAEFPPINPEQAVKIHK